MLAHVEGILVCKKLLKHVFTQVSLLLHQLDLLAAMFGASSTTSRRQVADPSLGVGDFMKVLRAEMASSQSWDLRAKLAHPSGPNATFSWKTAPSPTWMSSTATLMYRFVSIAPNGTLQGSKVSRLF